VTEVPRAGAAQGPVRWRAPGRVNLVGEHTDYNGGLALPFAIEQGCTAEASLGGDLFTAASAQAEGHFVGALSDVAAADRWVHYVLGAAVVLESRGVEVPPLGVSVDSEVPSGAGLSSSAAVICSVVAALDELLGLGFPPQEQVRLAVAVENDVAGAPTGGLDQLAAIHGREGEALLCDFADRRRPSVQPVPLDLRRHGLSVLVVDTGVRHAHADGEYAARRRVCERAARMLGVDVLGRLRPDDLPGVLSRLDDAEMRRCVRHVVLEDDRVLRAVALLRAGRVPEVGPMLSESHASLRDDYQVSCPELDLTVREMESAGALGARMTGGGFGGCAIGLVPTDEVEGVAAAVVAGYGGAGLAPPRWFTVRPSPGTRPDPDGAEPRHESPPAPGKPSG
jgi:galactokinase